MSMPNWKMKRSLLKASKWIDLHPDIWTKYELFGKNNKSYQRGFDVLGACYPHKRQVFSNPSLISAKAEVREWITKNFPYKVRSKIAHLNDKSKDVKQAVRRVRAYVGQVLV